MLALSFNVEKYLGGDDRPPDVLTLTGMFFFLNFLAATQDIAVDGWALTMLKRHNVGHASTCNSVGQTAGYFLVSVLVKSLRSLPSNQSLFPTYYNQANQEKSSTLLVLCIQIYL